jgi:hypothetical protein
MSEMASDPGDGWVRVEAFESALEDERALRATIAALRAELAQERERRERYDGMARVAIAAIDQYRTWQMLSGYDGPIAPNAAMKRIGEALWAADLTMADIESTRAALDATGEKDHE